MTNSRARSAHSARPRISLGTYCRRIPSSSSRMATGGIPSHPGPSQHMAATTLNSSSGTTATSGSVRRIRSTKAFRRATLGDSARCSLTRWHTSSARKSFMGINPWTDPRTRSEKSQTLGSAQICRSPRSENRSSLPLWSSGYNCFKSIATMYTALQIVTLHRPG